MEEEESKMRPGLFKALNHPALQSLRVQQCESLDSKGRIVTTIQTILTCTKLITADAMRQTLQFMYTGTIESGVCILADLKQAAEFLQVPDLFR